MIRSFAIKVAAITLPVLAGLYLIALALGVFAYDRGAFITAQGLYAEDGMNSYARGTVYSVKMDRALGPDRLLYTSLNASEAWQFLGLWDQRGMPPSLLKLLSPGGQR